MRNFLTNINIVGAVIMYRYFDINEMCLNQLVTYCDKLVILLDNYDENCEKKVLEFQEKHDNVEVIYSKVERKEGHKPGKMYSRLIHNINQIREQVLRRLEDIYKEKKIDMFIHLDPDEIFCKDMPQILTDFWNSNKQAMYCGMMSPFNDWKTLWEPSMYPHARIYKYRPDITSMDQPRHRDFYRPYLKEEATSNRYCIFHLPYFTKEYRDFRDFRNGRIGEKRNKKIESLRAKVKIYCAPKDVRTMTRKELRTLLRGKPSYNFGEYLDKFKIIY